MKDDTLYRWTFLSPLLKCVGKDEARFLLVEVHTEVCAEHLGDKARTHKILSQGYFWPTNH